MISSSEWDHRRGARRAVSIPQKTLKKLSQTDERRRFRRVRVNLLGRCMLADGREYPCQVRDISPGGMAVVASTAGKAGERVVAYVDDVGRLEGVIVRVYPTGFAMKFAATPRKRDKLAAQLTWLANRQILGLPEDRRYERIIPRNPHTTLVMPNGISVMCRIIDMSLSGAAVASETKPPVGTLIQLGKTQGRVVRISSNGFAVEFTRLQHPDFLEESVTAP